jgi:hypothetical protein
MPQISPNMLKAIELEKWHFDIMRPGNPQLELEQHYCERQMNAVREVLCQEEALIIDGLQLRSQGLREKINPQIRRDRTALIMHKNALKCLDYDTREIYDIFMLMIMPKTFLIDEELGADVPDFDISERVVPKVSHSEIALEELELDQQLELLIGGLQQELEATPELLAA